MQGAQEFVRTAQVTRRAPGLMPTAGKPVATIAALATGCRPGWSLPGAFYSDEAVYRADLEHIWQSGWLFAGHSCEIPNAGDYLTIEVDTDSLIVLRGDD